MMMMFKKNLTIKLWLLSIVFIAVFTAESHAQVIADSVRKVHPQGTTFVLFPDVQNYVKFDYNQPVLELLTAWTAANQRNLNIRGVFCTGDLVDQNETLFPPFPRFGNLTSKEQWQFVSHAFGRLDGKIPYFISPGNHDYGYTKAENDLTNYPDYFPIEKNSTWKSLIRGAYPNRNGRVTMENAAFELAIENWPPLLIVTTEFAPRDEVLDWIEKLSLEKAYSDHFVILLTHSYMDYNGQRIQKENYTISRPNAGQQIWDKLLVRSRNIKLVICGHVGVADENYKHTTGFRQDTNEAGNTIAQLLFNTQTIGGGWSGNGGDGWLRLLEFLPDGREIAVRTYSPLFGFSTLTKQHAWRRAPYDEFSIKY